MVVPEKKCLCCEKWMKSTHSFILYILLWECIGSSWRILASAFLLPSRQRSIWHHTSAIAWYGSCHKCQGLHGSFPVSLVGHLLWIIPFLELAAVQIMGLNDCLPTGSSTAVSPTMKNFSFTVSAGSPAVQQSSASTSPVFSLTQFGSSSAAGMILS